jgi:3-oxoacyl-[acyl-carrier protein] reductase
MAMSTRAAIVTGSSQGIGAAVAERLARDGWAVTINYSGHAEPAQALAEKIGWAGGQALAVKADVSDPGAVRQLFAATHDAFGGVDALVNNAGIMKLAPLAETDDALFDQHVAINLKGVFNCLREGAHRPRRRPHRQLLVQRRRPLPTDLRRLRRHQGRRRGDDPHSGQGAGP